MTRRALPDPVRGAVLAERVAVDLGYLARLAEHSDFAARVTFTAFCVEALDDLAAVVPEGPPRETAIAHALLLRNHPQTAGQVRDLARGWVEYAERTYTAVEQEREVQTARTPREVAEAALTERASEHEIGLGERCVRADRALAARSMLDATAPPSCLAGGVTARADVAPPFDPSRPDACDPCRRGDHARCCGLCDCPCPDPLRVGAEMSTTPLPEAPAGLPAPESAEALAERMGWPTTMPGGAYAAIVARDAMHVALLAERTRERDEARERLTEAYSDGEHLTTQNRDLAAVLGRALLALSRKRPAEPAPCVCSGCGAAVEPGSWRACASCGTYATQPADRSHRRSRCARST